MKSQVAEQKLKRSFFLVRNDIFALQNAQEQLMQRMERIERLLLSRPRPSQSYAHYVGNKQTSEIHTPDCILARGTESNHQVMFMSRHAALQAGFSECICLN